MMKRIIALLMSLTLLFACTAMAEAPATQTVSIPASGVSFDVPADWYYAVAGQGEGSSLAELFSLPASFLDTYLTEKGYAFYATLDVQELANLTLSAVPGTPLLDMCKDGVDMDALMEGFLQTFTIGEVVDSCAYRATEGTFARIHCTAPIEGGTAQLLIYVCNTNATMYIFNFVALPGGEFPEAELDAIINSVVFAD